MNKYLFTVVTVAYALGSGAQQVKTLTAKDYEHAESFMSYNTQPYIDEVTVRPIWLTGDKFVYSGKEGEYFLVDPVKKTRTPAFDKGKLAASLSRATGTAFETAQWANPGALNFSLDGKYLLVASRGKKWKVDLQSYHASADEGVPAAAAGGFGRSFRAGGSGGASESISPDGKRAAFIKDNNLWVRDLATGARKQLTIDGVTDYGYATDNSGWKSSDRPILLWSPDSKKIATFQQDQRKVSDMYLVATTVGKPVLRTWKYPLPGDADVIMLERVIIDVDNAKVIRLQMPADQHRSTLSDDIVDGANFADVAWNTDGSQLLFVSTSRDHKKENVRMANATTGAVREVFEEVSPTQFESGQTSVNWRYLSASNEIIWYSERDNWGHLYLYDALTGKLKNQVTKGDFAVTRVVKVDEKNRIIYFYAGGREPGNPYFAHFYKISFDGKNLVSLTPEEGNHQVTFSPSGAYFTDTYSTPDVPPTITFKGIDGKVNIPLEKTDVSRLTAKGWRAPKPVSVKAHDGKTDIYGLVFTPTAMDPGKKYPVIDYIYPGPQGGSVGSWSFSASRGDHQALAELGFIVVLIEGTGNPDRSKSFHDMNYGNMAENTLPDQIAGIRQLAQRYPIDTNKVGIWGHSGGGFATAAAMFRYPDFFKVGISESGNHDNRNYEDNWGERYNGLMSAVDYNAQANQVYAKNLKGKLMLAHGLMDDNVPSSNTMLVVEALEKANKSFDLVIFPNSTHGYGTYSPYMMRRRWDYFVKNLLGAEPPINYQMKERAR